MNGDDQILEYLLKDIPVMPPSSNLEERIISAAVPHAEKERSLPFSEWLLHLTIPRSAYALAFTLVLGVLVGLAAPSDLSVSSDPDMIDSFLYDDEGIL